MAMFVSEVLPKIIFGIKNSNNKHYISLTALSSAPIFLPSHMHSDTLLLSLPPAFTFAFVT